MKIKNIVSEGAKLIGGDLARLDAEVLLASVLGESKEYLFLNEAFELDESKVNKFFALCERRRKGEPVAYLIGKKEFYGMDFYVDGRVLIPRPETEHLVEEVVEFAKDHEIKSVIDVGTGSGAIACAMAKALPDSSVTAVEVSKEALEVAKMNVARLGFGEQIDVFQSDLLKTVEGRFDVIVANLPYIGESENSFVSREAVEFEPHVALFGGSDGLVLYERLFQEIVDRPWNPKILLGEVGFAQREGLQKLLSKFFDQFKWEIKTDLAGFDRYFVVVFE